jgi:hypothetical protein
VAPDAGPGFPHLFRLTVRGVASGMKSTGQPSDRGDGPRRPSPRSGPALDRILDAPELLEGTRAVLSAVEDRLRAIRAGDEIAGGIRSIPSPGHTPGHISVGVETGAEERI